MSRVLGIDAGGLGEPSWLAFLEGDRITLSQCVFSEDATDLPWLRDDDMLCVAIDAPQGLARPGEKRRAADAAALPPVGRLPANRAEMAKGMAADGTRLVYIRLVRTGVEVFWTNREYVLGLTRKPRLVETYPRAVFRALLGCYPPSKRNEPYDFCVAVTKIMCRLRLSCPGVEIPSVDQCDAVLCALAARAFVAGRAERLGRKPVIRKRDQVLREGYIVIPSPPGIPAT